MKDLEGQLSESKRLLELRNAELARLQSQIESQGKAAPATPTPPPVSHVPKKEEAEPEGTPSEPNTSNVPNPATTAANCELGVGECSR